MTRGALPIWVLAGDEALVTRCLMGTNLQAAARTAIAACVTLLLSVVGAAAQIDVASDNELYAGYCSGVLEKWRSVKSPDCTGADAAICRALTSRTESDAAQFSGLAARFERYLKGKGYGKVRSALAEEALAASWATGQADGTTCNADGLGDSSTKAAVETACSSRCSPPSGSAESDACYKCRGDVTPREPFGCLQAQRCLDVTFLPF